MQFNTKIKKAILTIGLVCSSLNAETITHNGFTYGTVTSPYTGRVWLDRNLGASRVCTALDDTECYGDYYQWGRGTDGHEKANSAITSTLTTDITASNGKGSFIKACSSLGDWTTADNDGSLRVQEWSKIDGTSICPVGYRVPTIDELTAETINANIAVTNSTDAFNNFLKLPTNGFRLCSGGLDVQGLFGSMWSSSVDSSYSRRLGFNWNYANETYDNRAKGASVRCLRD